MIKNVNVYLINGTACDLIAYKKGFELLDSSTGEEVLYSNKDIESIEIETNEGTKTLDQQLVSLEYFDSEKEIYCYRSLKAYEDHKNYMIDTRLYCIDSEDIIGNNEILKVEYKK